MIIKLVTEWSGLLHIPLQVLQLDNAILQHFQLLHNPLNRNKQVVTRIPEAAQVNPAKGVANALHSHTQDRDPLQTPPLSQTLTSQPLGNAGHGYSTHRPLQEGKTQTF